MSRETLSPKFHDVSLSRTIEKVNHASAGKVAAPALSIVEEGPEYPRAARVLELAQRLGLDLADALARHRELQAHLFQRVVGVHADAEAHAQHALLARCESGQCALGRLPQLRLNRGVARPDRPTGLDGMPDVG